MVWDTHGLLSLQNLVKPQPWKPDLKLTMERHLGDIKNEPVPFSFDLSNRIVESKLANKFQDTMKGAIFFPTELFVDSMDNIKKNCITPYIKRMCAKAGFQCVCGNITTTNDGLIKRHRYNCFHGTYQRPKRNNNKDERSKNSNKPQKDKHKKCKFCFKVCKDIHSGKFFFQKYVAGFSLHSGHHKIESKHVHVPINCLDDNQLKNIIDQLTIHIVPSHIKVRKSIHLDSWFYFLSYFNFIAYMVVIKQKFVHIPLIFKDKTSFTILLQK